MYGYKHGTMCSSWGKLPGRIAPRELASQARSKGEPRELGKGDCCTLILTDNGGAWEKHNPWLLDLASPSRVAAINGAGGVRQDVRHQSRLRYLPRPILTITIPGGEG